MNVLAADASSWAFSIALKTDMGYEERMIARPFSPAENLLPEAVALLDRAGIALRDLDLCVCPKGPGSFTGLRIAFASLKGIVDGSSAVLVSVPTLLLIEKSAALWSGPILSAVDAKKNRFYFRLSDGEKTLIEDTDGNPSDKKEILRGVGKRILVTGPDAALFKKKADEEVPGLDLFLDPFAPRPLARTLIELGLKKLNEVGPDDEGSGPVYIRRSDAEEMLERKRKEGNG